MAETRNHLGLDKFQLTIIKGNYASIKPSLTKRDKAYKKIEELTQKYKEKLEQAVTALRQEAEAYDEQIAMIDKFTVDVTIKSCGIGLTTEQVMTFIDDPVKFEDYKRELGLSDDLFNNTNNQPSDEVRDLDTEEDKNNSGELKEAV